MVQAFTDNQKAQSGTEPDEEQLTQVREQIWQSLVQKSCSRNRPGARTPGSPTRTDDWVRGDNPPRI